MDRTGSDTGVKSHRDRADNRFIRFFRLQIKAGTCTQVASPPAERKRLQDVVESSECSCEDRVASSIKDKRTFNRAGGEGTPRQHRANERVSRLVIAGRAGPVSENASRIG